MSVLNKTHKVTRNKRKNRKFLLSIFIAATVLLLSYIVSVAFNLFTNSKIYDGVVVENIEAGGMSQNELKDVLTKKYMADFSKKSISVHAMNYSTSFTFEKAKVSFDINSACEKAFKFGRGGSLMSRFLSLSMSKSSDTNIPVEVTFDKKFVTSQIESISKKVYIPVKEYDIAVDQPNKVTLITGHSGKLIKTEEAISMVEENIKNFKDGKIDLNVIIVTPKPLNIDEIYQKVSVEPKDAYTEVVDNNVRIVPHVMGRKIDKAALSKLVSKAEDKEDYKVVLPVSFYDSKIKTSDVRAKLLKDTLSSYSTQFYTGDRNNDNRKENITIAVGKINGTIIGAGDVFSFNQTVGPRTTENGYKDAHAYIGGKIVDSTGGGICQVSTTLYNSVLLSDLNVEERHNHQFTVGYVPKGRDAAVAYGTSDFKFKNSTAWPIKVSCRVSADNKIYFSLIGTNEPPKKSVEFRSVTLQEIAPTTENINDPELAEGTTDIKEGMKGYVVETYKIVKQNGIANEIKLHTSRYAAYPKQIRTGTKKPVSPTPSLALSPGASQLLNPGAAVSPTPTPAVTKGVDDSYNPPVKTP